MANGGSTGQKYHYWAFISYSHDDERIASRLHRALESYRLPKGVAIGATAGEELPRRLFPIFRDRDELPGSSDLGARLREALASSRALIVVCSPPASRSRWVNEEIETFNRLGRSDRVFCVLADGEPGSRDSNVNCWPSALHGEPLACDLRPGGESLHDAKLRLIAGIVGLRFDDLKRRDLRRRRRLAAGGSVAAALLLAGVAGLSWFGLEQRAMADARTLASASVRATELERDPVAGLELAIDAAERSPTSEAIDALLLALEHQRSELILDHGFEILSASYSNDGGRLLTCGRDTAARVWDPRTGKVLRELESPAPSVLSCVFSPDDTAILTLPEGSDPEVWDAATGSSRFALKDHPNGATFARFSETGRMIVSADAASIARIWEAETGREEAALHVTDEALRAVFLINADSELLAIDEYGVASVWDWRSATQLRAFGETMTWVNDVLISPDGTKLLLSNYQYRPYLWHLPAPGELIDGAMAITHTIGAAFSPDSSTLAVGGGDGVVTVFDTTDGFRIKQLQHPTIVSSLAFSPNGRLLVTAADAVRVWDTPVLGGGVDVEIETLRGHVGSIRIEGFAPGDDTRILTIGEEDHTVRVWDISSLRDRADALGLADLPRPALIDVARATLPARGSTGR